MISAPTKWKPQLTSSTIWHFNHMLVKSWRNIFIFFFYGPFSNRFEFDFCVWQSTKPLVPDHGAFEFLRQKRSSIEMRLLVRFTLGIEVHRGSPLCPPLCFPMRPNEASKSLEGFSLIPDFIWSNLWGGLAALSQIRTPTLGVFPGAAPRREGFVRETQAVTAIS